MKTKLPMVAFEGMQHQKCAGCGEFFMIDKALRDDLLGSGEYFYCPRGCSLTFDETKSTVSMDEDGEGASALRMSVGETQLSARPIDDGLRWNVNFGGHMESMVLNEIINDMYDRILVTQGIDTVEMGVGIRGTASSAIVSEARELRGSAAKLLEAANKLLSVEPTP